MLPLNERIKQVGGELVDWLNTTYLWIDELMDELYSDDAPSTAQRLKTKLGSGGGQNALDKHGSLSPHGALALVSGVRALSERSLHELRGELVQRLSDRLGHSSALDVPPSTTSPAALDATGSDMRSHSTGGVHPLLTVMSTLVAFGAGVLVSNHLDHRRHEHAWLAFSALATN